MKQTLTLLLAAILLTSCAVASKTTESRTPEARWMEMPDGFHSRYELAGTLILSRHNLRSPFSGKGSVLSRITPHEWIEWSSAPGELSRKGTLLEIRMGQFFRQWLLSEGLLADTPEKGEVRFYANSLQRTIATARSFAAALLPLADITVEHPYPTGTMDPVFNPQIQRDDESFKEAVITRTLEISGADILSRVPEPLASDFAVIEKIIDIRKSPAAANDTTCFRTDDFDLQLNLFKEPSMTGGFKLALQASDALIMQHYESDPSASTTFGHKMTPEDWHSIATVEEWYVDILFGSRELSRNAAAPLLATIKQELGMPGRKLSFLCGHDSNLKTVLTALDVEPYNLPGALEMQTPIGSKLVICKWKGVDGELYASLHLVYATERQLCTIAALDMETPPMAIPLRLNSLDANEDGLYKFTDLLSHITAAIE